MIDTRAQLPPCREKRIRIIKALITLREYHQPLAGFYTRHRKLVNAYICKA